MMKKLRKKIWIVILVVCVALLVYLHYIDHRGPDSAPAQRSVAARVVGTPQELLVDLRDDVSNEEIRRLESKYGLRLRLNSRHSLGERLYRSVARLTAQRLSSLGARLVQEPAVELVEPDQLFSIPPLEAQGTRFFGDEDGRTAKQLRSSRPSGALRGEAAQFPNDPKYKYQWHLDQIAMPKAWPRRSGKGVIVAVIDTGVAYRDLGSKFKRVPDLAQTEFVKGYDFVNDRDEALDDHGHGTHVAGTIAQSTNNGIGVAGVAFRARIMPLKVLSARGFGSVADIADAIRFAADHGAKVINMSLGANRSSSILAKAVTYAHKKGVTVVCAAGNNGRGQVSYPAAYPEAIAVAATQFDRSTTFYSNWGKEIDVAAPGGNTRVDQNNDGMPDGVLQNTIAIGKPDQNDYLLFMGTSMASPHVAGVAALVIENGVTKPDAVERVLKSTARHPAGKQWDPHYGAGIVDAGAAVGRTATDYGLYTLALSGLLGIGLLMRLRGRGQLLLRPGVGAGAGLLLGASGLFFLPGLALGPLQSGLPAWDLTLLGVATPLGHSALVPLALALALWSVRRLRGLLFGLAVGVAGHLLFKVSLSTVDIAWIPNVMGLDQIWLGLNGMICLGLANLLARR